MNQINGKQESLPDLNAKQLGVIIGYKYLGSDVKSTLIRCRKTNDKVFSAKDWNDPDFQGMHFGVDGPVLLQI